MENTVFNDEWIENPTPEEAAAIDRHNRAIDAVEKAMMVLVGMIAIGLVGGAVWHYIAP